MDQPFPPPGFVKAESNVSGIEVFKPSLKEEEVRPVVSFHCPQCGASTAYGVAEGGLTCTHCGYYEPPEKPTVGKGADEFEFKVATMDRAAHGWGEARKDLTCENCGARTSIPAETLSTTCPFCGSNEVIQLQASQDTLRPRFLVPFVIDRPSGHKTFMDWIGSSWMTPRALRQLAKMQEFVGIYLPFWTIDSSTSADWTALVGHTETERYYDHQSNSWKTRSKVVWRWESGQVDLNFDDILVDGTERISALLMDKIRDTQLDQLAPFEPEYLAGFQAQSYDVTLEQAWETAREQMREETRLECRSQASTNRIRNFSMNLDYSQETWRYILLPFYLVSYNYRGQAYQVIVNGQTGSIAGQRPADWRKIWLVIAGLVTPGLLTSLTGLLLAQVLGPVILGIGLGLLVAAVIAAIVILIKATRLDDV